MKFFHRPDDNTYGVWGENGQLGLIEKQNGDWIFLPLPSASFKLWEMRFIDDKLSELSFRDRGGS